MSTPQILIGADPELFMVNPNHPSNRRYVNAHGHIPGTKDKPHPVRYGAVQVDGMALEYNIDPAKTMAEFVRNNKLVLKQLGEMVPGYNLEVIPWATFPKDYFDAQPDSAKELGCSPDFNAWTRDVNPAPESDMWNAEHMRVAAGHIHIGWTEKKRPDDESHFNDCCLLVRQLDYYLGLPSLLYDADFHRRRMYGRAGAFRPKPYGVEYRVLSNKWIESEALMKWVYYATRKATIDLFNGLDITEKYEDQAVKYINEHDRGWFEKDLIQLPVRMPPT